MSTRPPIPQGNPPTYAFVTRLYKRSLRPVVLICATCAALWTLLWGVENFQDIDKDRDDTLPEFVPYDIALGALYSAAFAIQLFGIVAATLQRHALVRIYSYGTVLGVLLVFAAQILGIVLNFKYKGRLLQICIDGNTDVDVDIPHGWWGSSREHFDAQKASDFCNSYFKRAIFAVFAWLIVTTVLALIFMTVVFSYARQMLDPAFSRAPSNQVRMETFATYPAPPGPPPAPGYSGYGGYGQPDYVPAYDPQKLPGYEGTGRATPEKDQDQKQQWGPERAPEAPGYSTTAPPPRATNPFGDP